MRSTSISIAAVLLGLAATSASAQNTDSAPFGPLTTNNGASACVEFGDCTQGPNTARTATQQSPVRPPPTSVAIAAPTDAAQSQAYLSQLAATGAAAAFTSRSQGGMDSNARGATSVQFTGTVAVAGTAPSSVANPSRSGSADAAVALGLNSGVASSLVAAAAAAVLGAAYLF